MKKTLVIMVFFVFLLASIGTIAKPESEQYWYRPGLELEIVGGFGLTVYIYNAGGDLEDLECSIVLEGGFILIGRETVRTMDIQSGMRVPMHVFVLGFGNADIVATAGTDSISASGFVLGPFVLALN